MADNKAGRDKQAHDEANRQREREIATELERMDEPEPPVPPAELSAVEQKLQGLSFPVTAATVVGTVGDHAIDTGAGSTSLRGLLPDADVETFESPTAVRERIQRPTVAKAMKQIVESSGRLQNPAFGQSQRHAYEKTLTELQRIDAVDDDEGIQAITEWVLTAIEEREKLPDSRSVRREAAKICRKSGHEIRTDEWLGI